MWGITKGIYRLTIVGDASMYDNNVKNDKFSNLIFTFYLVLTLFMFIIMLNLLISIIGDSYEIIKSQEKTANGYER